MRNLFYSILMILLAAIHCAALYALLHPEVSRQYRAYYIDRTSTDWMVTHYKSAPEEGIILSRPGLPDFVDYSYGISVAESFGRWSDTSHGLRAGFKFNQLFQGQVCVSFEAGVTPSMLGRQASLAFGAQATPVSFLKSELQPYAVGFDLQEPASNLEFRLPTRMPPASATDGRQLGIGLARIRILPGRCEDVSRAQRSHP